MPSIHLDPQNCYQNSDLEAILEKKKKSMAHGLYSYLESNSRELNTKKPNPSLLTGGKDCIEPPENHGRLYARRRREAMEKPRHGLQRIRVLAGRRGAYIGVVT